MFGVEDKNLKELSRGHVLKIPERKLNGDYPAPDALNKNINKIKPFLDKDTWIAVETQVCFPLRVTGCSLFGHKS